MSQLGLAMDRGARLRMAAITSGGLGHLRPAPGTWGSMPPVLVAGLLLWAGAPGWAVSLVMAAGVVTFSAFCVAFADEAEARFRKKDPSQVVADETAGQSLALLFFPADHWACPALLALGFLAFRALDIVKPPPIRRLQDIPGGWGILLDDLLAGAMALGVVHLAAALS